MQRVIEIATASGAPPLLVGGPVRDLLLGRAVTDVDLLLPDALEPVARACGRALGARVVLHARFLTARLETDAVRIDLSRARREHYPRPGALPVVVPASVEEDLQRRDFSIHAMALPLHASAGRDLLDPFDGEQDLRRQILRTLHAGSFLDDPTRMFRAARYASRLGLRLAPATRSELVHALSARALGRVSGSRIAHEVWRLLEEPEPSRAAARTAAWGLFEGTARGWKIGPRTRRGLRRYRQVRTLPPWSVEPSDVVRCGRRILLLDASPRSRGPILERLGIRGAPGRELEADLSALPRLARSLGVARRPSRIDSGLSRITKAGLLALWCCTGGRAAAAIERYARELRPLRAPFDGHAARRLGARGPEIGELLRAARRRVLDGQPVDEAWAGRWLTRRR